MTNQGEGRALDADTRAFIDRMGIRFERDGMPRISGQMFGLLLVSREPRSLDEIAAAVQVSKASVSSNARLLERQGLVVRSARPGDRRDYYGVAEDMDSRMLEHRLGVMREMQGILEVGLATPGARDAKICERLTCVAAALSEAVSELTARIARVKQTTERPEGASIGRAG